VTTGTTGRGVADAALRIEHISKTFGATKALDRVSLTVQRGEVHALLGENGSGKSTLIKILSGYHAPDPGGTILVAGRPFDASDAQVSYESGLRFVHQNLGLVDSCSVADNLSFNAGFPTRLMTVSDRRVRARATEALRRVSLDIDPLAKVEGLSPAERTGVAVARALQADNSEDICLLVLDEPTATLPEDEVARLLETVRTVAATGTGVLYVTHRLEEVFTAATVATVLRDGREVITTPVAGLTRPVLLNYLVGDEFEPTRQEATALTVEHAEPVLTIRELWTNELAGVSMTIGPGEVVGIAGITGSGREQILGAVFGATGRVSGEVIIDGSPVPPKQPDLCIGLGTAFVPANRQRDGGFSELTARENVSVTDLSRFWRLPFLRSKPERAEIKDWFERLDVRPPGAYEQRLGAFSGGNQQKLIFAKWFGCGSAGVTSHQAALGIAPLT